MLCFVEIGLGYPDDLHNDSCSAPEKMKETIEILSEYHRE